MIDIDGLMGPVPAAPSGAAVSADDQGDFAAALALANGNGPAPDGQGGATASADPATIADPNASIALLGEETVETDGAIESEAALLAMVGATPTPTDPTVRQGPQLGIGPAEDSDGPLAMTARVEGVPGGQLAEPMADPEAAVSAMEAVEGAAEFPAAAPHVSSPVEVPAESVAAVRVDTTPATDPEMGDAPIAEPVAGPTATSAPMGGPVATDAPIEVPAAPVATADVEAATEVAAVESASVEIPEGRTADTAGVAPTPTPAGDAPPAIDTTPRVAPVAAPAPTAEPSAVVETAEATPAPATPTPEATPTQQVAEALREVRRLADGSHRLSLQLHPEELGAVQLEVAVRDGQLHVRAVAETEMARSTLEQNLPELRNELRDAGVRAGSLEVGPDASGRDDARSSDAESGRTDRTGRETTDTTESPEPTHEMSTDHGVDIRI